MFSIPLIALLLVGASQAAVIPVVCSSACTWSQIVIATLGMNASDTVRVSGGPYLGPCTTSITSLGGAGNGSIVATGSVVVDCGGKTTTPLFNLTNGGNHTIAGSFHVRNVQTAVDARYGALNISGITFTNCTLSLSGSGTIVTISNSSFYSVFVGRPTFFIHTSAHLAFTGCSIDGVATNIGDDVAAIEVSGIGSSLTMDDCVLQNISGRVPISISNGASAILNKVEICANKGTSAGGIEIVGAGSVATITNCKISYNSGTAGSGAVALCGTPASMLLITDSWFVGNTGLNGSLSIIGGLASLFSSDRSSSAGGPFGLFQSNIAEYGGGVYISGRSSFITIVNFAFSSNLAHAYGGVIYASDGARVVWHGTSSNDAENNFATYGGVVYMCRGANVTAQDVRWGSAFGSNDGGAVYASTGGILSLSDSTLDCNIAGNGSGGGIAAVGLGGTGGSVALQNVVMASNTAGVAGGGLYLLQSSATVNVTIFSCNTASYGAGIAATDSTSNLITLTDVVLTVNTVLGSSGAAISSGTPVLMRGGEISRNLVYPGGGGSCTSVGGAVALGDYAASTFSRVIFRANQGGLGATLSTTATGAGVTFQNVTVQGSSCGSAVYVGTSTLGTAYFMFNDSSINSSYGWAGALALSYFTSTVIANSTITDNWSAVSGAKLAAAGVGCWGCHVTLRDTLIARNRIQVPNLGAGFGCSLDTTVPTAEFYNVTFQGNIDEVRPGLEADFSACGGCSAFAQASADMPGLEYKVDPTTDTGCVPYRESVCPIFCGLGLDQLGNNVTCNLPVTTTLCNAPTQCPFLNAFANGVISQNTFSTMGSVAVYACNYGYSLVGNSTRTCQPPFWAATAPTCVANPPPSPPPPASPPASDAPSPLPITSNNTTLALVIGIVGGLIIVTLVFTLVLRRRRSPPRKQKYDNQNDTTLPMSSASSTSQRTLEHGNEKSNETPILQVQLSVANNLRVVKLEELRVKNQIGSGGSGIVFVVEDLTSLTEMAFKTFQTEKRQVDEFVREVTTLSQLRHPCIVQCLGVVAEDSTYGILLELMDDRDLESAHRTMSFVAKVRALTSAARGLAYLHHLNVVHADVKPRNILTSRGGRVAISDFGLSGVVASAGFTPAFAAPEVIRGERASMPSDIYSLGLTVSYILVGSNHNADTIRSAILPADVPPTAIDRVKEVVTVTTHQGSQARATAIQVAEMLSVIASLAAIV